MLGGHVDVLLDEDDLSQAEVVAADFSFSWTRGRKRRLRSEDAVGHEYLEVAMILRVVLGVNGIHLHVVVVLGLRQQRFTETCGG